MKMYCVVEKLLAFCLVKPPCFVGLQCYRQTTFYCFVNILYLYITNAFQVILHLHYYVIASQKE